MGKERRRFYRLRLPTVERLSAQVNGQPFWVLELSEGGLRVVPADPQNMPDLTDDVDIEISLPCGEPLRVKGRVARRDGKEVVVVDLRGVSFAEMLEQQRRLINKYSSLRPT